MSWFLSAALLSTLWPHAKLPVIQGISGSSVDAFAKYPMTVPELQDFFAQCSEETGGGMAFVESGHYSAERAHQVWPNLFPTAQSAQVIVGDEKALFNRTYGGRMGNREGTDDGYDFRGQGMIQLTGRDWFLRVGMDTGLDLINHPELAASPSTMLVCALSYWKLAKVNETVGDFTAEVIRVNGGTTNMAARLAWRAKCQEILTEQSLRAGMVSPPSPVIPGPNNQLKVHPSLMSEIEAVLRRWL